MDYEFLTKLTKHELINILMAKETGPLSKPDAVRNFIVEFSKLIKDWNKEHFLMICLDTKNFVVAVEVVSIGHLSASLVHPREVFKKAIGTPGTANIIVGHNHPSGDPSPSIQDDEITKMLVDGGRFLGIPLLDHIIFSNKSSDLYSYSDKNKL